MGTEIKKPGDTSGNHFTGINEDDNFLLAIKLPHSMIKDLTPVGRIELEKSATKYLEGVLNESGRIAGSEGAKKSKREITAQTIRKAEQIIKLMSNGLRKNRPSIGMHLCASTGTLITGKLLNLSGFSDWWHITIFLVIFGITIWANLSLRMNGNSN